MRLSQGGLAYTVTTLVHILLVKLKFSTCAHPITLDIALPVCLKRLLWTRLGWIRCAAGWSPHAGDGTYLILALDAEAVTNVLSWSKLRDFSTSRPTNRGVPVAS
ncbi:hypothetical protein PABG_12125 [Paracoccidioides brasiliensis Pb03]|nr:hypothetical protein PABG_12125 [Paracoccidioides brasiliensis Pb03]